MSRTNHHRDYHRWNFTTREIYYNKPWTPWAGELTFEDRAVGMETWDLRFYAGCRRTPQVIHRLLDFRGQYPIRIHYGRRGRAKGYADHWEAKFRGDTRRYEDECRAAYNAGYDVDDVLEPNHRPRSIEWDLW